MASKPEPPLPGHLQEILQTVNGLMAQINDCVQENQWEMLPELLSLRQQALEELFSNCQTPDQHRYLTEIGKAMVAQDSRYMAVIKQQQKLIEQELNNFGKGRKALQAYNQG